MPETDCDLCGSEWSEVATDPGDLWDPKCPKSKRPCGHHCNCVAFNDYCHWCKGEVQVIDPEQDPIWVPGSEN